MLSGPRIEKLTGIKLVGFNQVMSLSDNKTRELWEKFLPRITDIKNREDKNFYSVEQFDDSFFEEENHKKKFLKWAAVRVKDFDGIPDPMIKLDIPEGMYAVFNYKGKPSEAAESYRYIFTEWLPPSEFSLDNRPHFALMGQKYKGEHPDSEEEIWIPVSIK